MNLKQLIAFSSLAFLCPNQHLFLSTIGSPVLLSYHIHLPYLVSPLYQMLGHWSCWTLGSTTLLIVSHVNAFPVWNAERQYTYASGWKYDIHAQSVITISVHELHDQSNRMSSAIHPRTCAPLLSCCCHGHSKFIDWLTLVMKYLAHSRIAKRRTLAYKQRRKGLWLILHKGLNNVRFCSETSSSSVVFIAVCSHITISNA